MMMMMMMMIERREWSDNNIHLYKFLYLEHQNCMHSINKNVRFPGLPPGLRP